MFWHNFKYTLKIILRDYALIFWTLAFPLIMATFFNLAFSNIESSEKLNLINIAVVDNSGWQTNQPFHAALTELSREDNPDRLFQLQIASSEAAAQLLAEGEIAGYLDLSSSQPELTVAENSTDVTILKSATEAIATEAKIVQQVAKKAPAKLVELSTAPSAELDDQSPEHLSYTMIEYYSLIAMACLYGGMISMVAINHLLANMSNSGKRIAMSPAPKWQLITGGLLASYLIQLFSLALLFIYTTFVLNVDYGAHFGLIVVLSLVGALAGLAVGVALAVLVRSNENAKTGLLTAFTIFGCFLAGMMGITMKYLVDTNLPLLNRLNPANLITDGLYALYYYPTFDRFWGDVATLAIITLVMIGVSIYGLRKEQYDNL